MSSASLTFGFEHLKEIGILGHGAARGVPSEAALAAVPAAFEKPAQPKPPPKTDGASPKAAGKQAERPEKADKKADKKAAPKAAEAPAAAADEPFVEATPEEQAKMTKDARTAYHKRRIAAQGVAAPKAKAATKAERRAVNEANSKAKEDKKEKDDESAQLLADLKLQGLSEDQAQQMIIEMKRAEPEEEDDEEDDEEEDFLASVKRWVSEQEKTIPKDALRDFNMKVRFQGHVDTTPPDHLRALLHIICVQVCEGCDLKMPKLQPTAVAKVATPVFTRWAPLLEPLYGKIDDIMTASDAVCEAVMASIQSLEGVPDTGQSCGLVGCLMAIREIDMIEDEDLLTGCKRLEPRSRVLDKFVEFLEDEVEGDEDDSD